MLMRIFGVMRIFGKISIINKTRPNKALHRNAYAALYKNYFIDRHPVNAGALGGRMKYTELTIDQRINLKAEFINNPDCNYYLAIWRLWDFVTAVELFLNDDVSILYKKTFPALSRLTSGCSRPPTATLIQPIALALTLYHQNKFAGPAAG